LQAFAGSLHGFDHQPTFADVMAAGLFHINVLSGVERQNRRRRVPMVGCGDKDGLNAAVVKYPAHVGNRFGRWFFLVLDIFRGGGQTLVVDIADVGHLDVVSLAQGM